MASNDVRRPGGLSRRGFMTYALDRSYWRWRFIVLDKHSPIA
ncbi:MAG: hypothetical protein ACE5ED_08545 [Rhodothalassiaceae bacterium]